MFGKSSLLFNDLSKEATQVRRELWFCCRHGHLRCGRLRSGGDRRHSLRPLRVS